MGHKYVYEAIDRSINMLCDSTEIFAKFVVVFAGDWRQYLPVVPWGSDAEIINATLKLSYLWKFIGFITLQQQLSGSEDGNDKNTRGDEHNTRENSHCSSYFVPNQWTSQVGQWTGFKKISWWGQDLQVFWHNRWKQYWFYTRISEILLSTWHGSTLLEVKEVYACDVASEFGPRKWAL